MREHNVSVPARAHGEENTTKRIIMGINTQIRLMLAKPSRCPQHWHDGYFVQKNGVVIHDILTSLFNARGPNYNYMFTGNAMAKYLLDFARLPFNSGQAHTVIICADNQLFVPNEKREEQKRRDDSKQSSDPYPDSAEFCAQGIFIQGKLDQIDIRRVMKNRSLRKKLWQFVLSLWTNGGYSPPVGCTFIFDHFASGAWVIDSKGSYQTKVPTHGFGEADLKVPYWVARYCSSGDDIAVHSTDSDLLPILVHACASLKGIIKSNIKLRYWKRKWLDVVGVCDYVTTGMQMTSTQFITACVLCGSDYVDKGILFYRFGIDGLFDVFEQNADTITAASTNVDGLREIVRRCYQQKLNGGAAEPQTLTMLREMVSNRVSATAINDATAGLGRATAPPTDSQLDEVFVKVKFNTQYWAQTWQDDLYPKSQVTRSR
jgi:hypothetical protein